MPKYKIIKTIILICSIGILALFPANHCLGEVEYCDPGPDKNKHYDKINSYSYYYELENNIWGSPIVPDNYVSFKQCIYSYSENSQSGLGYHWDWPNDSNSFRAYPHIVYGKSPFWKRSTIPFLPAIVGERDYFVSYEVNYTDTLKSDISKDQISGIWNLAFDIWLTTNNTIINDVTSSYRKYEIMIWSDAPQNYSNPGYPGMTPVATNILLDNNSYDLYFLKNMQGSNAQQLFDYYAFVAKQPSLKKKLNINSFVKYLLFDVKSDLRIDSSVYLSDIEFGSEVKYGSGGVKIDRYTITESDPDCTYTISENVDIPASAFDGSLNIATSPSNCFWTAASDDSWITIKSGTRGQAYGTGSNTVSYSAVLNTTGASRTGTIYVGNHPFTLTQTSQAGVCGSDNGLILTVPPVNLCSEGTASPLLGSGPWSWTCTGPNGGPTVSCSANIQTHNVTFTTGANGTISGTASQVVNYGGSTTAVTAVPATNYHLTGWTGNGNFIATTNNPLIVTNVIADMIIMANFASSPEAGVCDSDNGLILTVPPVNLCSEGTASPLFGSGPWSWTCTGSNGGSTVSCSANIQTHSVTFTAGAYGTISGNASQVVNHGGSTTAVTAVPATNYHLTGWTGTGNFIATTNNPLIVTNVIADMIIMASFASSPENVFITNKPLTKPLPYKGIKGKLTFDAPTKPSVELLKEIVSLPAWIIIDPATIKINKDKGSLIYNVLENSEPTLRSGQIKVGAGSYTITQDAHPCKITSLAVTPVTPLNASGGEQSLTITLAPSNCQWKVSSYKIPLDTWFSSYGNFPAISELITGSKTVAGTVGQNISGKLLNNVVIVVTADGKNKKTITMKQNK